MTINDITPLIKQGESNTLEFKRSTGKLKNAAETLCGFLNGQGGRVIIGVSDNQEIIGQQISDKTRLDISHILKQFEPTANIHVDYVKVNANDDAQLIVMTAYPDSRSVPYCFAGRAYEREQADTHIMSQARYNQLLLARQVTPLSWETECVSDLTVADLDREEIIKTVKLGIKANHIDSSLENEEIETILKKFRLMEHGQLTGTVQIKLTPQCDL